MASRSRSVVFLVLVLLLLLLGVLFARCHRPAPAAVEPPPAAPIAKVEPAPVAAPASKAPDEQLAAAVIIAPSSVGAGTVFRLEWTGPDNKGDYVTIVAPSASPDTYGNYLPTSRGHALDLPAPIEPGEYELRYVTGRSRTVLGRAAITVTPAVAILDASASASIGTSLAVKWTGPNNPGDYITVVAKDAPDSQHGSYQETASGNPVKLTLPVTQGDMELRYLTGQGGKVLGRRALTLVTPPTSLDAPAEVVAGAAFKVTWVGLNNPGDYITIVPKDAPDGQHQNYMNTSRGSPLPLTAPIWSGPAELRYMPANGARVFARRAINVIPAVVTLTAPAEVAVGTRVAITWSGPANNGDYITVVPKATRDGEYARYTDTNKGSPLTVEVPKTPGPAEIRYMSGQGAKVLARRDLTVVVP